MDTEKQPKETFVEQMERVNRTNPFMIHNNIRAVALSEDAAEVCAEVTEDSLNAMQTVHGGLMFVMAEIAAGLVTRNDGRKYVTLDSSFRFLRGSSAKELRGVAKITKRGKTVCFTKSQVMESETGRCWQRESLRFTVWESKTEARERCNCDMHSDKEWEMLSAIRRSRRQYVLQSRGYRK